MKKTIRCKNNFGGYIDIPIEKISFRPSVYGFIYNNEKILTLTTKSTGKFWFPGGGINIGERLEDALKREIIEETGIEVSIEKPVLVKENFFYYEPLDEAYHAFLFFYLCEPISLKLLPDDMVNDLESTQPRWTKISEIIKENINDFPDEIFSQINNLKSI